MTADDLSRIAMSPSLGSALARASEFARQRGHLEVTLEHMLLSLCEDAEAGLVLAASNIDSARLKGDVTGFLENLPQRGVAGQGGEPGVSLDLRRILEAAAAAARGGRRREINGAIVLAAIVGDGRSPAAQMLQAQGLTFEGAIRALQRSATPTPPPPSANTEDILASARERVASRTEAARRAAAPPHEAEEKEPVAESAAPAPSAAEPKPAKVERKEAAQPAPAPEPAPEMPPARVPEPQIAKPPPAPAPEPPPAVRAPEPPPPAPAPMPEPVAAPAPPVEQPLRAEPPPADPLPGMPPHSPSPMPPPIPGAGPGAGPGAAPPPGWGPPGPPPGATPPPPPASRGAPPATPPPIPPPMPSSPHGNAPLPGHPGAGGPPPPPPPGQWAEPPRMPMGVGGQGQNVGRGRLNELLAEKRSGGPPGRQRIEVGQLVENIPRTMRVAVPKAVEVRIAKAAVKQLAEGLQGGGAAFHHDVTITKAMSVRLRAPDGGFFIETASPETQWIERANLVSNEDFASWRWHVTPREKGKKRLQLVISARTVGADGLAAETALPDQVITVRVRTNYGKTFARVAGWCVAALIGGLLAKFGEGLLTIGMSVVAKLMTT